MDDILEEYNKYYSNITMDIIDMYGLCENSSCEFCPLNISTPDSGYLTWENVITHAQCCQLFKEYILSRYPDR